ncbi:MAG: heat-inducible transcription repressor HrcA [Candidatus Aminicenantes bacterium]|nr:heat-inducible transcription repressor HrcA [Candidatus Aminicenantes bacterium]
MKKPEKDMKILRKVIENYLKVGKPVSSGFIKEHENISVSSATIRNIMARLEQKGYLFQPHIAAGRVPTDVGLRYYVNFLLKETLESHYDFNIPSDSLDIESDDFNSLLDKTSKLLSDCSDNMGFVISPQISELDFKHLRFIRLAEDKVLLILITSSNIVLNDIVMTSVPLTQEELDKFSRYINLNFRGRNLTYIKDYLIKEVPKYRIKFEDSIHKLSLFLNAYFDKQKTSHIYLQGTSKILEKAELFDTERLISLFRNFEEKNKLARLLSDFISLDRVKVVIGSELSSPDISECSLIMSHYGTENQVLGSLGILGPKRLPYKKIIPLVDLVAKKLSQTICYNQ